VRAGLVGDQVGAHAAPHQLGQDLGGVAQQAMDAFARRCSFAMRASASSRSVACSST
jgi:hypothetical protein